MLVLLTPYGLRAQDEAQTTLETFAEEASACYNESNSYEVEISVRDFQKIKELELYLAYDGDIFNFEDFVPEATELSGISVTELPGDTLLFQWSSTTPVDIANDPERAVIGKLQFSIDNFPLNTAFEYPTALTWDADKSEYLYEDSGDEQVLTGEFTNGSLTVTVAEDLQVITVTPDPAVCYNSTVDVTVEPDGFEYSFNGQSYTDNNVGNSSPGENTVQVRDENGCISLLTTFTINAPEPVTFEWLVEDAKCFEGNGEIQFYNVTGGTPDYTYYVIPDEDIDDVRYDWFYGDKTMLDNFAYSTNQLLRKSGSYWIAVQDVNNCVKLFDVNESLTNRWEQVYIDQPESIGATAVATADVSCFGQEDGEITATMGTGGTPWNDGAGDYYKVSLNGGIPLEVASGATTVFDELPGGTHTVAVMDMYCTETITVEIQEPLDAAFSLDYEDVACVDSPNGQIWIEEVWWLDPAGNDTLTDLTGWTFEVFGPGAVSEGTADVDGGIVDGLAPNNYSVFVSDPNGCVYEYSNPDGSGNKVPVMSPELIDFDVIPEHVVCQGSATGKITVTSLSGAVNYELSTDGTNWQEELIFEDLTAGVYTVQVRDADNLDACVISQDVTIEEPEVALDLSVDNIYAPTCDGGNDGNATAFAQGGWPFYDANDNPYYEYSLDGSPYWVGNPTFAVTEGSHTLTVRDSMGCEVPVEFVVDDVQPIEIEVTTPETDPEIYCFDGSTNVLVSFISEANDFDDEEYTYKYSASSDMSDAQTLVLSGTDMTFLSAGTWYFTAEDPNGCVSAPYELEIEEGEELEVLEMVPEDATCFGYWDGSITIKMTGGSPFLTGDRYKYIIKNNYAALSNPDNEWLPFYNDDVENDSTLTVMLQKGSYWIAVKDSCDMVAEAFQIEGFDAIEIAEAEVGPVTCYGDDDGYIDLTGSVTGGNEAEGYLYSLSQVGEGTSLIVEDQESPVFDELVAGTYMISVTDANGCPAATETYNVLSPAPLDVQFDSLYVSCNGAEDGEIFIDISGGTGGTYGLGGQETDDEYSTDGNKYRVVINNTDSEGISYGEYAFADDVDSKIFQVAAGEYEVIVYDANDCMFGPTIISIEEPEAWDVTTDFAFPSDCGEEDGSVSVTVNDGGWVDLGMGYQFKLNDGEWTDVVNEGEYTFDNVGFGTHTIYVQNDTAAIEGAVDPAINETRCIYSETVVISEASPFDYDVEVKNVSCHGGADGQFIITNVTGGQGTEGYQFQLVNSENPTVDEDMWLPLDEEGDPVWVTEFTFDTLTYGHHTLYIRDDAGYTLSKCQAAESWHIRQPDSLEIVETMWINDVTCNGGSDGRFEIIVEGGTPPYKYAYTESQVVSPEHPYQNMPDLEDESLWQPEEPVFTGVEAGTFIAWVVDANGCWIGGEIRPNGQTIDNHRVVIAEPEMIVSADTVVTNATCYGEANGSIVLNSVTGGNGAPFTYEVTGTIYDGTDTTYVFDDAEYDGVTDELTGLYASMDDTSNYVGPEDMYFIYAIDASGCRQLVDSTYITHPEEFIIDLVVDEDAFICANDLAGIVDIITVSGGTGVPEYQVYRDGALVRNWTSNASHVVEAGHTYKVVAKDENECIAEVEKYIESPEPITFDVINTSCYGDEFGSARIEVQGESDREFRVIYTVTESDIPVETDTTEWFTAEININNFVFDGENIDDVHYEITVEDNFGCKSEMGVFTFDPVQTQIILTTEVDDNMITASAIGGTVVTSSDYQYAIAPAGFEGDLTWMDDNIMTVDSFNTWVVYVRDNNWCWTTDTLESVGFTSLTIAEVQGEGDDSPVLDDVVGVTGTVTGIAEGEGFFMQDANAAWSGIWVAYVDAADLAIGDGAEVVGVVAEVADVTTIQATEVTAVDAQLEVEPLVVEPMEAENEMYESVLVTVEGARATAADEGNGEWTIFTETDNDVVVNDWLYVYAPEEGNFYDVTGVVNGRLDAFKVEPRMEADIVDLTATPADMITKNIEFNVYPNPFDGHIKIENSDKLTRVVITNIAGQRVMDVEYPSQEIRTANLVSGVYVVSMFTEDGLAKTERIVKR
ncbi:T9SS type A sorting domain-containing protein [Tangfeifania diversioriginum]|nr:T9SS type A sorting domain-containing protein [Tangfeifania diversioriginum]